jgi:hypothetical protein
MNRFIITLCACLSSLFIYAGFPQYPNKHFKHIPSTGVIKNLSDEDLLEVVQRQTFRFFWEYAHPVSGLARERTNTVKGTYYWNYIFEADSVPNFSLNEYDGDACAIGGTGFGIMAMLIATERGWITRDAALERLHKMVEFLHQAQSFHGVFPHFMNGTTGDPVTFGRLDEGGDLVETSYLIMGLLCAREYFNRDAPLERYIRDLITQLWSTVNWSWYENEAHTKLYWHWAPNQGFDMNFPIYGWNECLITYIIAASSPYHPITKEVYRNCWMNNDGYLDNHTYYGIKLPLGNWGPVSKGGPLFFEHYTFQGIDPNGLTDLYTDYAEQTRNHTLIQRAYCIENPHGYKGYGEDCWGLTAGDCNQGYLAHDPANDRGVIQPTAALSSMPYTPKESMQVLRHFYEDWGDKLWGEYGFVDGFNPTTWWTSNTWLAIDQGPIINMIENYRTGMLWKIFMNIPEIQNGLKKLGFKSPYLKEVE